MSLPLLNAKKQYVDQNGHPLVGGFVNFYQPGTTTRINTYQDQGLSILNSNPVVLDARGQAVAWVANSTSVREVVSDYLGNVIWDQVTAVGYGSNPIGPSVKDYGAKGDGVTDDYQAFASIQAAYPSQQIFIPAGTYLIGSNLALTSSLVFQQGSILIPKTGATITISGSIQATDYQIFSNASGGSFQLQGLATACRAAWFGVLPSNTASGNTAAWNVMIASMPISGGAHIMFPAGNINTNGFSHSLSGITVQGHDTDTWIINNSTNAFALESLGAGNSHNRFFNFQVGQASGITPVAGNGGVHVQSGHCKICDIHCFQFPAPLYDGIFIDGSLEIWLERNDVQNCAHDGFHFGGGCGDIYVSNNISFANGRYGFYFNGVSGLYGQNLNGFGNQVTCFYFDNTGHVNGSGTINEFVWGVCWCGDTSGSLNWSINSLSDSTFVNCWGSAQISTSSGTSSCGFSITGSGCNEIAFTNCMALSNNGNGFIVDNGATNIRLIGCESRVNGKGGGADGSGFVLGYSAAVTNVTMMGCRARSNPVNGILMQGASDYLIVSSCNTQGNTGTGLVNSTSGTHNQIGTGANV